MYNKVMFDAHCHIKAKDSLYCTSEYLPWNYNNTPVDDFVCSSSEIGLDKRFTSLMPIEKQVTLLNALLVVSKANDKPVTLHVVNATNSAIEVLRKVGLKKQTVLWHCFTGTVETAAVLYSLGVIISIGPRFHGDLAKTVKANPLFVLETDYEGTDLSEHERILTDVYSKASSELGISVSELDSHCRETLKYFV